MSWYGTHARYTKEEVKAHLPAATCKLCVYWFRCIIGSTPSSWYQEFPNCPRCGITKWSMLAELNQKLLGLSTPYQRGVREPRRAMPTTRFPTTGNATVDKWQRLYESANLEIRVRAAKALIARADTPLTLLLNILDHLWDQGLGFSLEKALLKRHGKDLVAAMIARLDSSDRYLREIACTVLGNCQDFAATARLLRMLDDPDLMVRRAAANALGSLKDVTAIPELQRQLATRQNDDSNVVFALNWALQDLLANR